MLTRKIGNQLFDLAAVDLSRSRLCGPSRVWTVAPEEARLKKQSSLMESSPLLCLQSVAAP